MPQGFIRIISPPAGDVPEEILKTWIGLVLPSEKMYDGPTQGLLTEKSYPPSESKHYWVSWEKAMEILQDQRPKTYAWYKENITVVPPCILVNSECCEVVPD